MRLLDRIFPSRVGRRLAPLAAEIARRSQPAVAAIVSDRFRSMSIPEARGYIRARARLAVQIETDAVVAADGAISRALAEKLAEMAIEQVIVRMIVAQVKAAPVRVERRRAA